MAPDNQSGPPLNPPQPQRKPSQSTDVASQGGYRGAFFRRSLRSKLLIAYGIAFGISGVGLGGGLIWAQQIDEQAQAVQSEALEDIEDVHHVQGSLVKVLAHHLILSQWLAVSPRPPVENAIQALKELRQDHLAFAENWVELLDSDEFGEDDEIGELENGPTEEEALIAEDISQTFKPDVDDYILTVRTFFQNVDLSQSQDQQSPLLASQIAELKEHRFLGQIDEFTERINDLAEATEEEQAEAQRLSEAAISTRVSVITGSILLSGFLGLSLVSLLTKTLLDPLKEMTQLTQQSVQEKDFRTAIPIRSTDELGLLAEAFNTYINFVETLLNEQTKSNIRLTSTLDELKQSQIQIVQSEKMSSLGQMIAGISHEINNPLGFIATNITYVQEYMDDVLKIINLYREHYPDPVDAIKEQSEAVDLDFVQEDLVQVLSSMKIGSRRIREIINSLRNFSRLDDTQVVPSDIHEGIKNTLLILKHRLKQTADSPEIKVTKNYGDLPNVECFPGLLNQVFMNILANAIDALSDAYQTAKGGGDGRDYQITITTSLEQDARWVKIAIADNGPGIPKDIQQQIFDPCFTTKPQGKGTGMGMSISLQIVTEKHGGRFDCMSTPGGGTTFTIQLPVYHRDRLEPQEKTMAIAPDVA